MDCATGGPEAVAAGGDQASSPEDFDEALTNRDFTCGERAASLRFHARWNTSFANHIGYVASEPDPPREQQPCS